jgi:hypothetical protein
MNAGGVIVGGALMLDHAPSRGNPLSSKRRLSMRRFLLLLSALMLASPAGAATLYYGARVGMKLTIVKKTGIGSEHASILARHDRHDATIYCREYGHDFTKKCIDDEMKAPLNFEITANCKTGEFTTFYGAKMLFQGRNKGTEVTTDYLIKAVAENVTLDGSGASGYDYTIDQFKALCPNRVK